MKFQTVSGAIYQIEGDHIRRVNPNYRKRADGEWVRLWEQPQVELGLPVCILMDSLSDHGPDDYGNHLSGEGVTQRRTTPVERIWDA